VKIASHQPQLSTLPGLKTALRGGGTRGSSTIIPGPPGGSNDTRGGGGYTHTHNTTFLQNNLSARDFVSRSSHSVTGGDLGILHPEQSLAAVHTSEVIR